MKVTYNSVRTIIVVTYYWNAFTLNRMDLKSNIT